MLWWGPEPQGLSFFVLFSFFPDFEWKCKLGEEKETKKAQFYVETLQKKVTLQVVVPADGGLGASGWE